MATSMTSWPCEENVLFNYFSGVGRLCTKENMESAITKLMEDYPQHNIYIGMTHNPCGRFKGDYNTWPMPFHLYMNMFFTQKPYAKPLNEEAHYLRFEKMFVLCYCKSEAAVRQAEKIAIKSAQSISSERTINITEGGNGPLSKDQTYYFIYACITKNKLLTEAILTAIV